MVFNMEQFKDKLFSKINIRISEKQIILCFGFGGTMPILQIKQVTFFTYLAALLLIIILGKLLYQKRLLICKNLCLPYFALTLVSICSVIVCFQSDIPRYWKDAQIKGLFWFSIYLLFYVYYSNRQKLVIIKQYLKGVYCAAVVQIMWGGIQFFCDHALKININDLLFIDTLHMVNQASQTKSGEITLSGLCWNAGNMAPLIVFGYAFSKNIFIKFLFIVFSFICGSRTVMLGGLTCMFLDFIHWLAVNHIRIKKELIYLFIFIHFIIFYGFVFQSDVISLLINKSTNLLETFTTMHMQSSARLHLRYWTSIPHIAANNPILTNLFGFGLGCSGYSQVLYFNQYADSAYAWVLECDYVNILWNTGFIGFVITYAWIIKYVIMGSRVDFRYLLFFSGILVEGITYNVMFNWCWIAILFLFIFIQYNQKPDFLSKSRQRKT